MTQGSKDFGALLQPSSLVLIILDHQDDFLAALSGSTRQSLSDSTAVLARIATACGVSVELSSLVSETFTGRTWPRLKDLLPGHRAIDRRTINCWEDATFVEAIKRLKKDRLLVTGLWTEAGVSFAALSALELGYEVFLATDASAGMSIGSHETAIQRMVQAGVVPVTWRQLLFEWYRAVGEKDTKSGEALIEIAREHGYLLPDRQSDGLSRD
jgi:nicotinamidase-related amidase